MARAMKTKALEKVERALFELGGNADEVAETLRKEGIRGVRLSECHCPVAKYLHRKTGLDVRVGNGWVWADTPKGNNTVEIPMPVRTFIWRFDEGEYDDLVGTIWD